MMRKPRKRQPGTFTTGGTFYDVDMEHIRDIFGKLAGSHFGKDASFGFTFEDVAGEQHKPYEETVMQIPLVDGVERPQKFPDRCIEVGIHKRMGRRAEGQLMTILHRCRRMGLTVTERLTRNGAVRLITITE